MIQSPLGSPRSSVSSRIVRERRRRKEKRSQLRLHRRPASTLYHFVCVVGEQTGKALTHVGRNPWFRHVAVPLFLLLALTCVHEGAHSVYVDELFTQAKFVVWWLGLGVLSSLGVGCGIQSGILFLFPHIIKVALQAQDCGTMAFESHSDMWFTRGPAAFECRGGEGGAGAQEATYAAIVARILPQLFIFGAGTALGEVPPYWVARAAAATGKANRELDGLMEVGSGARQASERNFAALGLWLKKSMLRFLERYKFWGVFVLAAVPNPAFDLCGIFCGQTNLPFLTFFVPMLLGKMFVKTVLQGCLAVLAFHERSVGAVLKYIDLITPDSWGLEQRVVGIMEQGRRSFGKGSVDGHGGSADVVGVAAWIRPVGAAWAFLMVMVVLYFVVSCIEQCAQWRVNERDAAEVKELQRSLQAARSREPESKESSPNGVDLVMLKTPEARAKLF